MRFYNLATLAACLGAVQCAPVSPNNSHPGVIFEVAQSAINDCGSSTLMNQTSSGSPKVSDCQTLADNIKGSGTWTFWPFGPRQIAQYGTCAFNVEVSTGWAKIGNEDVRDLIRDSINKFQWNGLVGSKGEMKCQGQGPGDSTVNWGLYHT